MQFNLTIHCDNAAFDPEGETTGEGPEVARILRALADRIEDAADSTPGALLALRDVNGNTVGRAYFEEV